MTQTEWLYIRILPPLVGLATLKRIVSQQWLGPEASGRGRNRPLLLTIKNGDIRQQILANAKNLKSAGDNYAKIYVKKDVHPGVRKEWQRLREAEIKEKERPENMGHNIHFDPRQRKLFRDGEVIDSWNPQFL